MCSLFGDLPSQMRNPLLVGNGSGWNDIGRGLSPMVGCRVYEGRSFTFSGNFVSFLSSSPHLVCRTVVFIQEKLLPDVLLLRPSTVFCMGLDNYVFLLIHCTRRLQLVLFGLNSLTGFCMTICNQLHNFRVWNRIRIGRTINFSSRVA